MFIKPSIQVNKPQLNQWLPQLDGWILACACLRVSRTSIEVNEEGGKKKEEEQVSFRPVAPACTWKTIRNLKASSHELLA